MTLKKVKNWIIKNKIIAILIAALLTLIIIVSFIFFVPPQITKAEVKPFNIENESTVSVVASDLKTEGLIRNSTFFIIAYQLLGYHVYPETYALSSNMNLWQTIQILGNSESNLDSQPEIMFIEGATIESIAEDISSITGESAQFYIDYWSNPDILNNLINDYSAITDEILNPEIIYPLEGYFYPDTYYIDAYTTPEQITEMFLAGTEARYEEYENKVKNSEFTYHEILTLASIIQKEANTFEDMKLVSSVFYNRLAIDMRLESNPTVDYPVAVYDIEDEYLAYDSPYNTYIYYNLPPGPIAMVGNNAITASLEPASSEYYYFIADLEGNAHFSTNQQEHEALINKYLR